MAAVLARANTVSDETAKYVAVNFYFERCTQPQQSGYNRLSVSNLQEKESDGTLCYYICSINTGGFVIVSAIDNIVPVLGYSFEGSFDPDNLPCGFVSWMRHYEDQIKYAYTSKFEVSSEIKDEWVRLSSPNFNNHRNNRNLRSVSPLLVSKWNQGSPYNAMCPADPAGPGGHCYAGCVATAMGQLLYYYRHPDQGTGSYSYNHPDYGTISADFGATTYDWDAMPSSLVRENDAVATLLFHLGVSVDMDYGPDGSGMWNHKAAYSLKTYFGYGPETQYYFRDSITLDWDSILVANLDQRKPLYYAGWAGIQSTSGHAFVCDGYQGTDYFHFNWGWGGSSDGYFYLDNLTPGGSNFNYAQEVIPMFPDTVNYSYPDYCSDNKTISALDGSIEDGSGWYHYLPNASCLWLIKPQDTEHDSVSNIKLNFNLLDTELIDSIVVYDGDTTTAPVLGTFSGNTLPAEITSSGDKLLVTFTSDNANESGGWIADYRSTLPVYCSGQTTLTDPSGEFSDGSGNKRYNNNSVCKWRIEPPGADFVTLWFTDFSTADSLDRVIITDLVTHEQLGVFSGSEIPPPVTASSGKMLLIFFTNSTGTGDGWDALYTSYGVGTSEPFNEESEAFLYPNPAKDKTNLYFNSGESGLAQMEILSISGKKIAKQNIIQKRGENRVEINLEGLEPAVYILTLSTDSCRKVLKLIVN
jgi:hypothetical protein